MSLYSEKIMPELLTKYKRLEEIFRKRWLETNKAFGFEVIQIRFNTTIGKTEYAIKVVDNYVKRENCSIEELDYEPVYGSGRPN